MPASGYIFVVASISLACLVGCNDRDRGRGPGGDTGVAGDSGTTTDGAPADAIVSDTSTATDGTTGSDVSTAGCGFDVKLEGLPTDPACGETWIEGGATLAFVNTTADDCSAGRCDYMTEPATSSLWLYPGRLEVRLQSASCTATTIEVDVTDYCGSGCMKAFAYSAGVEVARAENTGTGSLETLVLTGAGIDMVAVSSCEGQLNEIRFR